VLLKRDMRQPDHSGKSAVPLLLDGKKTEAVLLEVGADPVDVLVALLPGQHFDEEFHRRRVGIEGCEGRPVTLLPRAEDKALGFDDGVTHGLMFC